jgi:6-phosphogluconolactonase
VQGEVQVVHDVPGAFVALVTDAVPRSLALSGGETARQSYELLGRGEIDWGNVEVFFGDERWVPVDHPDSNEGMARRAFLDEVEPRAVHSMREAGDTPDAAAGAYDALLRDAPPIDLVHLGLGPDGHTASLFPGSPALDVRDRLVVATGDDLHPHPRVTFTFPAIERARLTVFTVAGAEKRDAFARVQAADDVPAARVTSGRVIWLVDPAVAR